MKWGVTPTSGSALGFSQPLSGFQASSNSTALFQAATVPERPLRVFPSRRSCTPLGATGFPAVIHRCARTRRLRPYHPAFHRLPRQKRSRLDPRETMNSLSPSRSPSPGCSGPPTAGSLPTTRFTHFEAFFPPRVRSHRNEFPRDGGRSSPGLWPPLKTLPLEPVHLDPQGPRGNPARLDSRSRQLAAQRSESPLSAR